MKKTVKTNEVVVVFNLLKNAKYTKMSDADKIAAWKIFKAIKPIASSFIEDVNDAKQKMIPYEMFLEDLRRAQAYELAKANQETFDDMSDDEYKKFINQLAKYNQVVNQAVKEYAEKDIELEFEPLTADALDQLRLSNDWTFSQADSIENFVCE